MKGLSRILFTLFYLTINNIQIGKDNDETELSAFFSPSLPFLFFILCLFFSYVEKKRERENNGDKKGYKKKILKRKKYFCQTIFYSGLEIRSLFLTGSRLRFLL